MVIMTLEKVPKSLRGELSRWMVEIQTGVFVGKLSALVRDLLWEKCVKKALEDVAVKYGKLTMSKVFQSGFQEMPNEL